MSKKEIRPMWTTTVDPGEYDIDVDMERMVELSNKSKEVYTSMDIGKVWGLYQAWKTLKETNEWLRKSMALMCDNCPDQCDRIGTHELVDEVKEFSDILKTLCNDFGDVVLWEYKDNETGEPHRVSLRDWILGECECSWLKKEIEKEECNGTKENSI